LKSAEKLKEFAKSEKVVIVGFFNKDASKERKVFEKVAKTLRDDFVFGIAEDEESLKSEKIKDGKGIVLYKKFDEKKSVFEDKDISEETVTAFINKKSTPIMDDIGPANYDKYLKTGLPMAYFFYGTPEERASLGPSFEKVAKNYQGKILFVYLDASQFGAHADNIGLKQEWPAFGIHIAAKQQKVRF
jgi:protein disulfide-isomerase A1